MNKLAYTVEQIITVLIERRHVNPTPEPCTLILLSHLGKINCVDWIPFILIVSQFFFLHTEYFTCNFFNNIGHTNIFTPYAFINTYLTLWLPA